MKILIIGSARHGKDTLASIICDIKNFSFLSSSRAALDLFIYDELKDKYNYKSKEECYNDRINHRSEWYDLICDYNKEDKCKLTKKILEKSNIYVGLRDKEEVDQCIKENIFDLILGVYDYRKPIEDESSNNVDIFQYADIIIPNSGTIRELENKVSILFKYLDHSWK